MTVMSHNRLAIGSLTVTWVGDMRELRDRNAKCRRSLRAGDSRAAMPETAGRRVDET